MAAGLMNIPDVPFPRGSGGEKNHPAAFQQIEAIVIVLFNNVSKNFLRWKFRFQGCLLPGLILTSIRIRN
jgi:hypothetical protein